MRRNDVARGGTSLAIPTMAAGEASGGTQGLSSAHWELFHDVQLTERCLRRSLGGRRRRSPGLLKPVDPPPPISECPAADHMEWIVSLVTALLQMIHALWTPEGKAAMQAVGLAAPPCLLKKRRRIDPRSGARASLKRRGSGIEYDDECVSRLDAVSTRLFVLDLCVV